MLPRPEPPIRSTSTGDRLSSRVTGLQQGSADGTYRGPAGRWLKPYPQGNQVWMTVPSGRDAHLSGRVAEALMAQAPDLFDGSPRIEKIDVLATKLP